MQNAPLPVRYHGDPSIFVNETWYKYCQEHNLVGKSCFFGDLDAPEDMHTLEMDALLHAKLSPQTEESIRADVKRFRLEQTTNGTSTLPNLGMLMSFAHMARLRFHLRPFFRDIYEKRLQSIRHVTSKRNHQKLHVSLHIRRADACDHEHDGYEMTRIASRFACSSFRKSKVLCHIGIS